TRVLADAIIAPPGGTPAAAARKISRLLDTPDPSVCAQAGARFLFDLDGAIEQNTPLDARLFVSNAARHAFERFLRSDSHNAFWQRHLSVSYNKVGDVQVAQSDLAGALTSYRDGLAIADRLAKSDPHNAFCQRDLSVSYEKVGNVQLEQGDLEGALT